MKISLIQPGRNNLKYLKWSYESIRRNQGNHTVEICVADDNSTDGTWKWAQKMMRKDPHFIAIKNPYGVRLGHTILYDELVKVSSHDICMIYHADMYLCPGALDAIEQNIKEGTIVSLTRIEPPLHPDGPEKVIADFGIEPEEFREREFLKWFEGPVDSTGGYQPKHDGPTEGIFAPWAFYKKDFQEINGHDPLFAPQSKEDSDIFNRFQLNGVKFTQTWEGCVYHMTCRGSRFADGAKRNPDGKVFMKNRETDEWLAQNERSTRNFIRKWGHFCKHDNLMKPIIPPKFEIGILLSNCTLELVKLLEPWCSILYTCPNTVDDYLFEEQSNTIVNLKEKLQIYSKDNEQPDILIQVNKDNQFTNQDFGYIQQMPEIINNDIENLSKELPCEFELGNLKITINDINNINDILITCGGLLKNKMEPDVEGWETFVTYLKNKAVGEKGMEEDYNDPKTIGSNSVENPGRGKYFGV
tara:strand:- start:1988 stop:3400 length:1413 start_codon:yes stop_codon:yes gene_type:complete